VCKCVRFGPQRMASNHRSPQGCAAGKSWIFSMYVAVCLVNGVMEATRGVLMCQAFSPAKNISRCQVAFTNVADLALGMAANVDETVDALHNVGRSTHFVDTDDEVLLPCCTQHLVFGSGRMRVIFCPPCFLVLAHFFHLCSSSSR
jgi:hypothetical protein